MIQNIVLLGNLPEPTWLHPYVESGVIRAGMNVIAGDYAGIAMAAATAPLQQPLDLICPGPPGCDQVKGLPILGQLSGSIPAEWCYFVLLELEAGLRRAFADAVLELGREAGECYFAAAHLLGHDKHHAMVEVMGDDHAAVLELVLRASDIRGVRSTSLLPVDTAQSRGMGTPLARARTKAAGRSTATAKVARSRR